MEVVGKYEVLLLLDDLDSSEKMADVPVLDGDRYLYAPVCPVQVAGSLCLAGMGHPWRCWTCTVWVLDLVASN